ncbi:transcriptional regulator domain-containing protein [Azospirillum sp. ST 5-10]|uniref:transcriptional regulator domain-containing protein n=1 Tax=unclassified Azospirillum TaxID=2630922 RepID=UPI003F4A32CB
MIADNTIPGKYTAVFGAYAVRVFANCRYAVHLLESDNRTLRTGGKAMTAKNDWRDPAAYQYALSLPASCWAWEFLRRNPDYQAHVEAARLAGRPSDDDGSGDWGLHCPGGPGQKRR